MTTFLGAFLLILAAAIIVPTLPRSRSVRLILAVAAIPAIVLAYQGLEARANDNGAVQMDDFIEQSERLLKEGKASVLLAAYKEYGEHRGGTIPRFSAAGHRAGLLRQLVREQELESQQAKP